jgi:hypothetical protein
MRCASNLLSNPAAATKDSQALRGIDNPLARDRRDDTRLQNRGGAGVPLSSNWSHCKLNMPPGSILPDALRYGHCDGVLALSPVRSRAGARWRLARRGRGQRSPATPRCLTTSLLAPQYSRHRGAEPGRHHLGLPGRLRRNPQPARGAEGQSNGSS